jgi:hypothetical protein
MTLYNVAGLLSAITLFLPIVLIIVFRLAWYKSFPALLIYYILVFSHSFLTQDFIKADKTFVYYYGITNNFLDAPLMLAFMTYFSKTALFRKRLQLIVPVFILFEIIVIAIFGYTVRATTIVMAPGLLLILIFSLMFFIHQTKITIIHHKAAGKAFIAASLLFAYGGYAFIYVVYYLLKTQYKTDTFLVYFFVTTCSSILISAGIFFERKRIRQLEELKVTREELRMIYGRSETKKAAS